MKTIFLILLGTLVVGCATPITMLKDVKTGRVVQCGGQSGFLNNGPIGYAIQKGQDDHCVRDYVLGGYEILTEKGTE